MIHWERGEQLSDHDVWVGRDAWIEIKVVPALGSKMISLKHLRTGREWLSEAEGPLGNKGYATSFADSDGSGWDEMFPTINACAYPEHPWQGTEMTDHGEVWSIPWQAEAEGERFSCHVHGVRLPYRLSKSYSFTDDHRLRIDYTVSNASPFPLSFLWAAHPLFAAHEGMEIIVPSGLDDIVVSYSEQERLGRMGDVRSWLMPFEDRPEIRLDRVESVDAGTAEKYYFRGELPEGRAGLHDPNTCESLTMYFPVEQVPYLAVWANYGGYQGGYHVALEPATGFLDDLSYAMKQGAAAIVEAGSRYHWYLEIELT
ncbi:aldose epimerase family protein [Paenibacillus guangzhouensis]|uniref:hypothetical protein n=1 Tax=Paenibacillus guangzhouensis TaxID=1473112 RepID=UPI001266B4F4|nr:hypothetical protein [Paenibacillus guangzhouensis]